jgi:hypothetical protein
MSLTHEDLGKELGISRVRVTQLAQQGMPVDSVEGAKAWREKRKTDNEAAGHISVPVQPLNLARLDEILASVSNTTGDSEMDTRINQQMALVEMTRSTFEQAVASGDPSQSKLYGNYDRAIATLLRLERERHIRLQEQGRLVDADEAGQRFGKILGELRALIERAELTVAPQANPDNPPKALKAFREFRDDLFRKISEYNPKVELSDIAVKSLPEVEMPEIPESERNAAVALGDGDTEEVEHIESISEESPSE